MQLEISLSAGKLNRTPENRFESSKSPKIVKIRPVLAFTKKHQDQIVLNPGLSINQKQKEVLKIHLFQVFMANKIEKLAI